MKITFNLFFRLLSRVILLILAWFFLKDFFSKGWVPETLNDNIHILGEDDSRLGIAFLVSWRWLGIVLIGGFPLLYLFPSLFGLVYLLRIKPQFRHILFFGLVIVSLFLYTYLVTTLAPEKDAPDTSKLIVFLDGVLVFLLPTIFLIGSYLCFRGKNLLLTDLGFKAKTS